MNTAYYSINRFGQTTVDTYGSSSYGGTEYSCNGDAQCIADLQTSTASPGAPDTGFGFLPDISSVSPMILVPVAIVFAVAVAAVVLLVKKTIRKRKALKS